MKALKFIDCCLQIIITMTGLIWFCTHDEDALLGVCFAVGANITSCLIHLVCKYPSPKGSPRYNYQKGMGIVLIACLTLYMMQGMFVLILLPMLLIIPVTVMLYIKLCIEETIPLSTPQDHEK